MNRKLYTVLLLLSFISMTSYAEDFKVVVEKNYAFQVNKDCQLSITNKYGDIILSEWDKDSILIDIKAVIQTPKKEKTEALEEAINFNILHSEYYVVATTEFGTNGGSFLDGFNTLMQTLFTSSNQMKITYTVNYPKTAILKLDNKYGNIVMGDADRNVHIKLKNGNLRIGDVKGYLDIEHEFGDAHIGHIQDAKIYFSFGDLDFKTAKHVNLKTRSARVNVDELGILEVESIKDKYYIGKIQQLTGKSNFSYFNISKFDQSMNLASRFGELNLRGIDKDFSKIVLDGEYTEVYIQIAPELNIEIDIEHNNQTEIITTIEANLKESRIGESNYFKTKGYVGTNPSKSKINIISTSGKITITQ